MTPHNKKILDLLIRLNKTVEEEKKTKIQQEIDEILQKNPELQTLVETYKTHKESSQRLNKVLGFKGGTRRCRSYCWDVRSGDRRDNTPIISYPCHGGPNQKFRYQRKTRQIRALFSNKCLDIRKNRVVQKTCKRNRKTQKWRKKGKKWISLANGRCMDVEGGHFDNGELITYPCHSGSNQTF